MSHDDRTRRLMDEVQQQLPTETTLAFDLEEQQRQERLRTAWAALKAWLALGPAPRLRTCPRCGHDGMYDATRCGYCWLALARDAGAADSSGRPSSASSDAESRNG